VSPLNYVLFNFMPLLAPNPGDTTDHLDYYLLSFYTTATTLSSLTTSQSVYDNLFDSQHCTAGLVLQWVTVCGWVNHNSAFHPSGVKVECSLVSDGTVEGYAVRSHTCMASDTR